MSLEIKLEQNETLIYQGDVEATRYTHPFRFAISNRALFICQEKHLAKESWHMVKVPLNQVRQVFLHRPRRIGVFLAALFLTLGGLALTVFMLSNVFYQLPETKVTPWPIIILASGVLLPFITKKRMVLVVQTTDRLLKWKPTVMACKEEREIITKIQQDILVECKKAGIHVMQ
jgi:hypothetical protein